jgi:hypothetical protein
MIYIVNLIVNEFMDDELLKQFDERTNSIPEVKAIFVCFVRGMIR